jgi:hypothetical protein
MQHNRYAIYHLLGRTVDIRLSAHEGAQRICGVVEKVWRDIFEGCVRVTVDGDEYEFREPSAIVSAEEGVHFLYGDVEFEEEGVVPDYNGYGESLHGYLRRTARRPVHRTVFRVGELEMKPRARWRSRVAV